MKHVKHVLKPQTIVHHVKQENILLKTNALNVQEMIHVFIVPIQLVLIVWKDMF